MFIKKTSSKFVIIAVYVYDMNIIETLNELREIAEYLKYDFKMKNLEKNTVLSQFGT